MNRKLHDLLAREGAWFEVLPHHEIYTAQERAAVCHVHGGRVAKVVVVHDPGDDWYALAVLPATVRLDLLAMRELTGRRHLRLARERDFARVFADCEVGARAPFGRLYGLDVFLDVSLAKHGEIAFEAGTHTEDVRMPLAEYVRIERPEIAALGLVATAA